MSALAHILEQTPVNSIADAVAVMTAIDQTLPDQDGLKWFNRLYLRATEGVRDGATPPACAPASTTASTASSASPAAAS